MALGMDLHHEGISMSLGTMPSPGGTTYQAMQPDELLYLDDFSQFLGEKGDGERPLDGLPPLEFAVPDNADLSFPQVHGLCRVADQGHAVLCACQIVQDWETALVCAAHSCDR